MIIAEEVAVMVLDSAKPPRYRWTRSSARFGKSSISEAA
jgi:hypothetical protein